MNKTVAIIDLDTPCYAASAVCDNRSILVTHTPTQKTKIFKNRTEFKELLKTKSDKYKLEDYKIEDIQDPEPVQNAFYILNNQLNRIIEAVQPDNIIYCISGSSNFRDELPLPTKYKSSREGMLRPVLLSEVRSYAKNKYNPLLADGEEADDMQIYLGYQELAAGNKPVLVTIDKDALAYGGLYLFNQEKPEIGIQKIPRVGYLDVDSKGKVRGQGFLWYCFQHIYGDPVDGYKPFELSGKRFGQISAYKALVDCKNESEALQVVKDTFLKFYPKEFTYTDWKGIEHQANYKTMLDLYFKCCRMKRTKDDPLDSVKFFEFYGVDL